jgi:hypothetical protein
MTRKFTLVVKFDKKRVNFLNFVQFSIVNVAGALEECKAGDTEDIGLSLMCVI